MSVFLMLALKLGLPVVLGAGGGHLLGGLIISQLVKFGIPREIANQLFPLLLKGLPQLLKCVDMKRVDELPIEEQREARQIQELVRNNVDVFRFR